MDIGVVIAKKPLVLIGLLAFSLAACGPEGADIPVAVERAPVAAAPAEEPSEATPELLPDQIEEQSEENIQIGVLLPLSGSEAEAGKALLNAAVMALFDARDPRLKIIPIDTYGSLLGAENAAKQAVEAGADIILGPLLGANVEPAGNIAKAANIPLISFSNDSDAAGPGRYVMGFLPENEVRRVVDHAFNSGRSQFAGLFPESRYGARVSTSFGDAVADAGGQVTAIEHYVQDADAVFDPVKALASYDARARELRREVRFLRDLREDITDEIANGLATQEVMGDVPFDAVLLPEGGALLRTLAPLLPFYEIDLDDVQLMGTGLWYDETLSREPPLRGAWFAAPDPVRPRAFLDRYKETYDSDAPRIVTIAYDAVGLVAHLLKTFDPSEHAGVLDMVRLTEPLGFVGIDGLFRFTENGYNERSLAILEITSRGFRVIDQASDAFPRFGYVYSNNKDSKSPPSED